MIEREFIAQKTKEFYIKQHIEGSLRNVGISSIKLKKIPLGEKIVIDTNRPSVVVGSKGSNIKKLTRELKKAFDLENPQIEINEVKDQFLDADIVAQRIVGFLERFGSARFKSVGHKTMANILRAGALGVEIIMSGKIPGARAKSWRFYRGYLKKCGDIALTGVRTAHATANLKSGSIGVKVSIMPPDLELPDSIEILSETTQEIEEVSSEEGKKEAQKESNTESVDSKQEKTVEESAESEEKTTSDVASNEVTKEKAQAEPEASAEASPEKKALTTPDGEEQTSEDTSEDEGSSKQESKPTQDSTASDQEGSKSDEKASSSTKTKSDEKPQNDSTKKEESVEKSEEKVEESSEETSQEESTSTTK